MNKRFMAILLLVLSAGGRLSAADWKSELEQKLQSVYKVSKLSKISNDVTAAGTVLVIKKDGISGDLMNDSIFVATRVKDGQIQQAGGLTALLAKKSTTRKFDQGDRVYVTDINVDDTKIRFAFVSVGMKDTIDGGFTKTTRFKGALDFEFPKNYLQTAALETLKSDFDAVIPSEEQANAVQTKTIALGQTTKEVESIMGKPETVVNLGSKITYGYKSMKIIFVDGKVADVQ